MDNITYAVSVDVNNPTIPYNVYVASVLDSNVRYLEITLYQNGNVIALSDTATATASLVTDNVLVDDSVNCTISDNIITVPLEDLQRHGNLDVQVTVTEGTKVLAIPFPIQVRVTPNIAEEAQVDENSMGSYAEVVQELADARGDYISLSEALNHKLSSAEGAVKTANIDTGAVTEAKLATDSVATAKIKDGNVTAGKLAAAFKNTLYKVNTTDQQPNHETCDAKTIYVGAQLGNEPGIIIPFFGKDKQMFIGVNGTICVRHYSGGNDYLDWEPNLSELTANKKSSITSNNQSSTAFFPSIKAVVDYIAALFATVINNDNKSSNALLPTIKAVVDYLTANYTDTTALNSALSGKMDAAYAEDTRYKVDKLDINIAPDPENEEYPSAYAAWQIANNVYDNLDPRITGNSAGIADLQAYLGYTSPDILGLCVDLENNRFTRLAGAVGKTAGSDFDAFPMFGGRRRCCVANDGTINAYYGEQGYAEDGTNGQVMVYQPKFYYRMVPLKLEKQASGLGYHIRKANYYVTANPHPGFKLHPLFYDANGNEVEYVLLSAYEGSLYDVSAGVYINDNAPGDYAYAQGDLLCSVAGKKPVSGKLANIGTKANFEEMAQTHGTGWHLDTIKSVSANQLLMLIELGQFNTQTAIGLGAVNNQTNGTYNCASLTGSTAEIGNETGMASATIFENGAGTKINTTNGKVSVSYRGVENPWGNIWKHVNGVNIFGNGTMNGGQAYIADNFNFNEEVKSETTINNVHYKYSSAGFSLANTSSADSYISAFGYGKEEYDWLFMPSEAAGNSSLPVGDNYYCTPNLNEYRIARFGGFWSYGSNAAGGFYWNCGAVPGTRNYYIGGRLLFVPTATV